jgi:phosphoserine phosphatase RsbU/P
MTAVAGDFYDFLAVDAYRTGFLVADVTGHGVPAALIASMVKVATQSVVPWA